jgi:hypothetical protein
MQIKLIGLFTYQCIAISVYSGSGFEGFETTLKFVALFLTTPVRRLVIGF